MAEQEPDDIPEEARLADEHLKKAKAAKVLGDDATADANVRAAWVRIHEAVEKALDRIDQEEE